MQGDILNTNLLPHSFLFLFPVSLVVEACERDGSSALTPAEWSSLAGLTALVEVTSLRDVWRVVCAASSPLGELWSWQSLIMSMQDFTLDDQPVAHPNNFIDKYFFYLCHKLWAQKNTEYLSTHLLGAVVECAPKVAHCDERMLKDPSGGDSLRGVQLEHLCQQADEVGQVTLTSIATYPWGFMRNLWQGEKKSNQ